MCSRACVPSATHLHINAICRQKNLIRLFSAIWRLLYIKLIPLKKVILSYGTLPEHITSKHLQTTKYHTLWKKRTYIQLQWLPWQRQLLLSPFRAMHKDVVLAVVALVAAAQVVHKAARREAAHQAWVLRHAAVHPAWVHRLAAVLHAAVRLAWAHHHAVVRIA